MRISHPDWQRIGTRKDGRPIYLQRGGSEPVVTPPADPTDGFNAAQQARVNALIAAERTKATESAKTKAAEDLAKDLGMSVGDAKALIEAQKAASDKDLTEAQKARRDADNEKTAATKERAEAKAEVFSTRAEKALLRAGVALPAEADDKDGVKAAAVLERVSKMLTVGVDATPEQIAADVKTLKESFPALFGTAVDPGKRIPNTDPKAPPRERPASGDAYKRGQERAAARFNKPDPTKTT